MKMLAAMHQKSNSAIIHTGYDASPGTLESQLVVAAKPDV